MIMDLTQHWDSRILRFISPITVNHTIMLYEFYQYLIISQLSEGFIKI